MKKKDFKPLIQIGKEIKNLKESSDSSQKEASIEKKYKSEIERLRQENASLKQTINELKNKETILLKDNEQIFKEYYERGFEDCKKKYLLDLDKCLSNIEHILTEKDKIYKEKSEEVKKLIISIVEEVIDKFLGKYKEQDSIKLILKSLDDILNAHLLSDLENKNIVYMNEKDLNNFKKLMEENQEIKSIVDKYNLKILPGNDIDKGDLVIVTDDLYISAKIKDKLEKILNHVKELILND